MRADEIHPGDVIAGKYRVRAIISRQPTLLVEGFHVEFDQRVVIKLLLAGTGDDKEIERFRREARTLAKLETEHAARILDVGTQADGSFYLVRQFVEGDDLGTYIKTYGARPLTEAVLLVLQAAEAVAETHSHNIILREISPASMAVTRRLGGSPLIKITDFGTAKLLKDATAPTGASSLTATALFGLSPYSSPELVRKAKSVDARADVWSLGAVFYALLAGRPPFEGDVARLMLSITREEPPPLSTLRRDLPPEIDQIVNWALCKDLDGRFKSVHAFAHALTPFAPQEGLVLIDRIGQLAQQAKTGKRANTLPPPSMPVAAPSARPSYNPQNPVEISSSSLDEDDDSDEEATVSLGGAGLDALQRAAGLPRSGGASARSTSPTTPSQGQGAPSEPGLGSRARIQQPRLHADRQQRRNISIPPPPPSQPPSPWMPGAERTEIIPAFRGSSHASIPAPAESQPRYSPRYDTLPPPAATPREFRSFGEGRGAAALSGQAVSQRAAAPKRADTRVIWGALAAMAVMLPIVLLLLLREPPKQVIVGGDPLNAPTQPGAQPGAALLHPQPGQRPQPTGTALVLNADAANPTAQPSPVLPTPTPVQPQPAGDSRPKPTPVAAARDPKPEPKPAKEDPPAASGGGSGKLLAIASGGSCAFSVDGSPKGSGGSASVQVPAGKHSVTCKPVGGGGTKSGSVNVKAGETSILTFRL